MTPQKIVERLEAALGADAQPTRLISAIEAELSTHFGLEAIKAAERAESVAASVAKLIETRSVKAALEGLSSTLVIVGTTSSAVAGSCWVSPHDTQEVASAKRGRLHNEAMLIKLRSLDFNEFEKFGKQVLFELGAVAPRVTPHAGDQGIDFFGSFSFGQLSTLPSQFLRLAHDVRLLFVGQAKHYPNATIGPNVVRELIGSVSLARTKTFSKDGIDIFAELDLKPFSPVVTMLFTTGELTAGAYKLAASAGIIVKSGRQLVNFLADRGVGMRKGEALSNFDEALFDDWLNR